jgi:hypothetical protein
MGWCQQHVFCLCCAAGDVTPNILGTFCLDSGLPCDTGTSTCNGNNQLCVGRGPAYPDDVKSTEIIGQRQADKAQVRGWYAGWGAAFNGALGGVAREAVAKLLMSSVQHQY